jgi:hypothetical protein
MPGGMIFLGIGLILFMLSINAYQLLSPSLQAEILWAEGVYLDLVRQTPDFCVELYCLHDYYVEISFDRRTGDPEALHAFQSMKGLEPYLHLINIDDIYQTKRSKK